MYAFAVKSEPKRDIARNLIRWGLEENRGIISTQVIQEFLNVALRKFSRPFTLKDAHEFLETVLHPLCAVFPSITYYSRALELYKQNGFSFYDCLIVAAALEADCNILYSEDMQHGRQIESLRIINPFVED